MIALAATNADKVTLAVGADVGRLRWALDLARASRKEGGLDPNDFSYGAAMSVVPLDDVDEARRLCAGAVASQARFSVMHGHPVGPGDEGDDAVLTSLAASYDMERHGQDGSQIGALSDAFIDRFAVIGPPGRCLERLQEITEMGFDHFTFYLGNSQAADLNKKVYRAIAEGVLPRL
jgi:5,10-methylenetetrahydromethanopterin reductase